MLFDCLIRILSISLINANRWKCLLIIRQTAGEFDVDSRQVLAVHSRIIKHKLQTSVARDDHSVEPTFPHDLSDIVTLDDLEFTSICSDYAAFLSENNAVDAADVYLCVVAAAETTLPLKEHLARCNFLLLNPHPTTSLQVGASHLMSIIPCYG